MSDVRVLKRQVHQRLLGTLDATDRGAGATPDPEALAPVVRRMLTEAQPLLAPIALDELVHEVLADVVGLGALEPLLADPTVDEIMVNGPRAAFVERHGRIEPVTLDLDAAEIEALAQRVVAPLGLRLDRSAPIVDARLPDGARLHAVLPPLAPDGPVVTIRRFSRRRFGPADFGLDPVQAERIFTAVRRGDSVLVAGATSTGKTSLLNVLAGAIDPVERILTVEDTAELTLPQPHVVRLEARPANAEGAGGCTMRELVRAALRMRPDRIVVGEVRGAEALDLLLALTTGHRGALCTVHAGSAPTALRRLATLALLGGDRVPPSAVDELLAAAIDLVVVVERTPHGTRRVAAVHRCDAPA